MKNHIKYIKELKNIERYLLSKSDVLNGTGFESVTPNISSKIKKLTLELEFGFESDVCYTAEYMPVNLLTHSANIGISYFSDSDKKSISCEDLGRQPENEWLLFVRFPTGAYTFGNNYKAGVFNRFFDELKQFNPKYIDTVNHCLCFDSTTALGFVNNASDIFDKYQVITTEAGKQAKIDKLQAELDKLTAK